MKKTIQFNVFFTGFALFFCMIAFFMISKSKAWFSYNTNVDSGGMQISVEAPPNISASVKSYGVIDINDDNNVFTLEPMVNGARPELYALPTDDPNNILYSKYHKALVLMIEITAPNDDVTIELEMWTDNVAPSVDQDNDFSNCIQLSAATYDESAGKVTVESGSTPKAFVSVENGECTKVSSIKLADQVELKKGVSVTLCYVIEYNADFIQYINNYIFLNALEYTQVDYKNDVVFSIY